MNKNLNIVNCIYIFNIENLGFGKAKAQGLSLSFIHDERKPKFWNKSITAAIAYCLLLSKDQSPKLVSWVLSRKLKWENGIHEGRAFGGQAGCGRQVWGFAWSYGGGFNIFSTSIWILLQGWQVPQIRP